MKITTGDGLMPTWHLSLTFLYHIFILTQLDSMTFYKLILLITTQNRNTNMIFFTNILMELNVFECNENIYFNIEFA